MKNSFFYCRDAKFSIENITAYWYNGKDVLYKDLLGSKSQISYSNNLEKIKIYIKHIGLSLIKCVPNCGIFKKLYPEHIEWGNKLLVKGE